MTKKKNSSQTKPKQSKNSSSGKQAAVKTVRKPILKIPTGRTIQYGVPLLFFICYFFFLLLYINPAVIYSSNGIDLHNYVATMHSQVSNHEYNGPPFHHPYILELTPDYFREVITTPGGLTKLAVTLSIYACHYPIAGSLVLTGLALFFFLIFSLYIQGNCPKRPFILRFVPPLFLLVICAWYELGYLAFLLPVIGALAFVIYFQRNRPGYAITRGLLLSLLFWCAWYLLQWGSFLVLLFTIIYEFSRKERNVASVIIASIVNGTLLFILDTMFLPIGMSIHWSDFTVLSDLPITVIVFFPFAAIVLAVWSRFRYELKEKAVFIGAILRTISFLGLIILTVFYLCKEPVNLYTRTIARTMDHVLNKQWDAILHENTSEIFKGFPRETGQLQAFMVHAIDRALNSTGHLGDNLFNFPQAKFTNDPLLMLQSTLSSGFVNWVVVQDLAMDLGMVNTAEKIAGELMENMGPFPDILYRRALVQIAKGNRDAAKVYLQKLAGMPFYRNEARRLLSIIDNEGAIDSEPRIAKMRSPMDTTDYFLFTITYENVLKNLLKSNPGNKAAFDYLMTYYLQTGMLDGVAELVPMARNFGYTTSLPRVWEEAYCVYLASNSQQTTTDPFSGIRPETINRFNEFARACIQLSNDPSTDAKLAPSFGDTYFYFSVFGHSSGK